MPKRLKNTEDRVIEVGPNLYAEFGIPGAAEKHAKIELAVAINQLLKKRALTQRDASRLLKCTQPEVSSLKNYKMKLFSLERLLEFLFCLGQDVEITIRKKARSRKAGATTVRMVGAA
jgi:predicted XRE-type DNA-binding protein